MVLQSSRVDFQIFFAMNPSVTYRILKGSQIAQPRRKDLSITYAENHPGRIHFAILKESFSMRHLFVCLTSLLVTLSSTPNFADERPNIVLIMADDLGVEGIGCYGGTSYNTPAIDRLAKQGVRFTHAYAQPLCTNTRVQLMTGRYNNRNWLYFGILDPREKTLGHYMKEAGYSTCIAGKWQLQSYDPPSYPGASLRRGQGMKAADAGFDEYSLFHAWHTEDKGSRFADPTLEENGELLRELKGEYGPDHWVHFVNDFITRKKDEEQPFFVYYAMALPHRPFVPTPDSSDWSQRARISDEDVRYFPDMVEYMDKCVGRVIDHIDNLGLDKNTVVLFFSDNGTHQKITSETLTGPVVGGKGRTTDAGTHVPLVVRWTGKISQGVNENLVDSTDFLPTLVEMAGRSISNESPLDGVSFLPQLLGQPSKPRDWVFCHYDPRPGWDKDQFRKIRFARDKRYKLYGDGKLYDVPKDKLERHPILTAEDTQESRLARQRLLTVLNNMPNPNPAPRDGDPKEFQQRLYLAANDALTVFEVNKEHGDLKVLQKFPLPDAGPFTFAPNRKLMYAVTSLQESNASAPGLATLQIEKGGTLKLIHRAEIQLRPGYLMTDNNGEFLAGNHYSEGKATLWKLDPIYRGTAVQELVLEPKVHSTVFSPDNHWLLMPATGPNKIFINHFTAQVGWSEPNTPPFVIGPERENEARQPRHLVFHPNLPVAYTTYERDPPGIGVWQWETEKGMLKPIQNLITQPDSFRGRITTADLHMTPNGRFLYLSNRDTTQRNAPTGRDSIVGFRVHPQTGKLQRVGDFPCERIPRSFTIDKLGQFLYVAGQGDGRLGAYRIEDSGELTKIQTYEVGEKPIWVETLSILD